MSSMTLPNANALAMPQPNQLIRMTGTKPYRVKDELQRPPLGPCFLGCILLTPMPIVTHLDSAG